MILYILWLYLIIDRRQQYNLLLLILDLRSYDLIISHKWFKYFHVLINTKEHCLYWPKELKPSYLVIKEILVSYKTLVPYITLEY